MPWIDPNLLDCVVYLYPSEAAAEDVEKAGGSGFLLGIPIPDDSHSILLSVATNRHVVDDGNMIVRINTRSGKPDIIALDEMKWYVHPDGDDLAICPVRLTGEHKFNFIPVHMLLTKNLIDTFDFGPGDDVFVVGRFVNHEGSQRNLPSVRFGNIAQMPWEPIVIGGYSQESFLVEAKSIAGYSGSPVFVFFKPESAEFNWNPEVRKLIDDGTLKLPGVSMKRLKMSGKAPMPFTFLLGVDWCHLSHDVPVTNTLTGTPHPNLIMRANTGMMGVVPAWRLSEIIQGEDMKSLIFSVSEDAKAQKEKVGVVGELDVARPSRTKSKVAPTAVNPSHKEDFTSLLSAAAKARRADD